MIVKDKVATIERASILADTLMTYIARHCLVSTSEHDDDPAEHIYMTIHAFGILAMRICFTLEEYCKIYGIEKLSAEKMEEWLRVVIAENIIAVRKKPASKEMPVD